MSAILAATVLVRVLELFHPAEAVVNGERLRAASLSGPRVVDAPAVVELPARAFRREFPARLHVRAAGRELVLVAEVDLEDYVAGVVASEMRAHRDAPEALRAQAVAARTYALAGSGRHEEEGYDLCDTTHCQHFTGAAETAFRDAAQATRGEALRWDGAPAHVYYHAHCGGRTADPADLWPGHARLPYLAAKDDPHHAAGDSAWTFSAPAAELADILSIQTARAPERVRLALGRRYGWSRVPGGLFSASRDGDRIVLRGRGAGHGAGLCQAGAVNMARAGAGYREVLSFYFPGTAVTARGIPAFERRDSPAAP